MGMEENIMQTGNNKRIIQLENQIEGLRLRLRSIEGVSGIQQEQLNLVESRLTDIETVVGYWVFDKDWKVRFSKLLATTFNNDEMNILLHYFSLNPDDFEKGNILLKAIDIVDYFDRRDQLHFLLKYATDERPNANWPKPSDF